MYTVLLADDEKSVLDILISSISWHTLGVDTVLTASDGEKALEIIKSRRVELLITDIRMPRMDGLELIRNVRSLYPDVHCILLTAYSEFSYAKEAIALGVENYLLKPVPKEEVEQTVTKALDNIYKRHENSERLLLDNTLLRWLSSSINSEELSDRAALLGINIYLPCYCVICIVKKDEKAPLSPFCSACIERLSKQYEVYHLWDDNGRYVLILGGKEIEQDVLEKTLETAALETDMRSAAAAVGITVQEANSLPVSYMMACEIIELADTSSSGVVMKKEINISGFKVDVLAEEVRKLFYEDKKEAKQDVHKLLAAKLFKAEEEKNAREKLSLLMKTCTKVLLSEFPAQTLVQGRLFTDWPRYDETAGEVSGKDQFIPAAVKVLDHAEQVFKALFGTLNPKIQYAIKYMRANMGEGISIKLLCTKNGTNPAYLGQMFKTETGFFFNDYLTRLRINRSVYLLHNPDNKIKDIAAQVGFFSSSYFEKCFKNQKGVSPLKYRMEFMA
ncbi:DNA-binding response regulator [Spirochaetia bacterium]|nr:DNA-binding response regulator [Spirochaetia bacterium]